LRSREIGESKNKFLARSETGESRMASCPLIYKTILSQQSDTKNGLELELGDGWVRANVKHYRKEEIR